MVIQMVAVGEESGGLDQMLVKIADFYDEEVNAAVETLTSVMEPIIIVVLATVSWAGRSLPCIFPCST